MVIKGGCPGKCPATISAFKGPVTGVGHHVVPQLGRLGEGLGAVAALVRPVDMKGGGMTQGTGYHGSVTLVKNVPAEMWPSVSGDNDIPLTSALSSLHIKSHNDLS